MTHRNDRYGTQYLQTPFTAAQVARWSAAEPTPELHLPPPNAFIASDFTLLPPPAEGTPALPQLVRNTAMSKLWYKQDTEFKLPKASISVAMTSPLAYNSPAQCGTVIIYIYIYIYMYIFIAIFPSLSLPLSCMCVCARVRVRVPVSTFPHIFEGEKCEAKKIKERERKGGKAQTIPIPRLIHFISFSFPFHFLSPFFSCVLY